jgi:hypothetical protein
MRQHQFAIRKDLGRLAILAVKWFFALSAEFVRCMSGGVYWRVVCCDWMKSSTSFDILLSILCRRGLKPLLV